MGVGPVVIAPDQHWLASPCGSLYPGIHSTSKYLALTPR